MSEKNEGQEVQTEEEEKLKEGFLPPASSDYKLLRKVLIYHASLAVLVISLAMIFPGFMDLLPVGGITDLVEGANPAYTEWMHEDPGGRGF